MAVEELDYKNAASFQLNNGTDASGNIKTVSVSLGTLSIDGWDAEKAMNIFNALSPCFEKSVYAHIHTKTTRVQYAE